MASPIATGSYTIIDYNDAPLLNGWINAYGAINQTYIPDTGEYSPDYASSSLRLQASLFVSGNSTDLLENPEGVISNIQWKVMTSAGRLNEIPGANTREYLVNANLVDDYSKTYIFTCNYTQPFSLISVPVQISINLTKTVNGTGIADLKISTPDGNIFKNGNAETLGIEAQLWLGSKIIGSVTSSSFKWWEQDPEGKGGAHGVGNGWKLITSGSESGQYKITFNSPTSTSKLEVPRDLVVSSEVYMCTCQNPDDSNIYKSTSVIMDYTDPITVRVESSGGDKFKNGIGSSILTARLFQAETEVDTAGSKYTYKWYKYDKNGNLVDKGGSPSDGTTPYGTGKKLSVTDNDVFEKATFVCDIY